MISQRSIITDYISNPMCCVIVKDPFAEEQPADDQLLIPNEGSV